MRQTVLADVIASHSGEQQRDDQYVEEDHRPRNVPRGTHPDLDLPGIRRIGGARGAQFDGVAAVRQRGDLQKLVDMHRLPFGSQRCDPVFELLPRRETDRPDAQRVHRCGNLEHRIVEPVIARFIGPLRRHHADLDGL